MRQALMLDTGGWLEALSGRLAYSEALTRARPAIVPSPVLPEIDWHLRRRRRDMQRLVREIVEGRYEYVEATIPDVKRAAEIDRKFADLGLGFVDSAVAAIAERLSVRRILTIDSDFAAMRIGRGYRESFDLAVPL
jgi:predicted nucleic acid-binding protein